MIINDFLHYSQVPVGSGERTIYGSKKDDLEYVYSDRLWQWDYDKAQLAHKSNAEKPHTSEYYEKFLSLYYDCPIKLHHIIIGVNQSNGYQYMVYGFKRKKQ